MFDFLLTHPIAAAKLIQQIFSMDFEPNVRVMNNVKESVPLKDANSVQFVPNMYLVVHFARISI